MTATAFTTMNKYGAARVKTAEGTFDSKAEFARWGELKLLERAKEITGLRRQVTYPIRVNNQHVCNYIADFVYFGANGAGVWGLVVEDVKGVKTAVYKLKKKLVEACHGIKITEIQVKRARAR